MSTDTQYCYHNSVCLSVGPPVCYTGDPHVSSSVYQNVLCTTQ